MPSITLQGSVKINQTHLQRAVRQELLDRANFAFLVYRDVLQGKLQALVADTLRLSTTLQELAGGPLQGELGIESPQPIIDGIIKLVSESLTVDFKIFRGFKTITRITCQPKDYDNILGESFARYISINRFNKSYLIDWLYWLLFEGDKIIITHYHSVFGSFAASRSKMAIMFPGGSWRMPIGHAGTADDNFITRAIGIDDSTQSSFSQQFDKIFKETIIDRM